MWTYERYSFYGDFWHQLLTNEYKTKKKAEQAKNFDEKLGLKCGDIYEYLEKEEL